MKKIRLALLLGILGTFISTPARAEDDEEMILPLEKRQVAFYMGLIPAPLKRTMSCYCASTATLSCMYVGGGGDLRDTFYSYAYKGAKALDDCRTEAKRMSSYIGSARAAGDKKIGFLITDSGKVSLRRVAQGKAAGRVNESVRSGGKRH